MASKLRPSGRNPSATSVIKGGTAQGLAVSADRFITGFPSTWPALITLNMRHNQGRFSPLAINRSLLLAGQSDRSSRDMSLTIRASAVARLRPLHLCAIVWQLIPYARRNRGTNPRPPCVTCFAHKNHRRRAVTSGQNRNAPDHLEVLEQRIGETGISVAPRHFEYQWRFSGFNFAKHGPRATVITS